MVKITEKSKESKNKFMKVTVTKNGPYLVSGGVPLSVMEICNDDDGYCRTWRETKKFPIQEKYALCRCGK